MKVKVLSSLEDKMRGVIGQDCLEDDEVYLFLDINPSSGFHMRDVKFPLDIGFLDKDLVILDINSMEPESGTSKAPAGTVYAVEANQGYFNNNKLNIGDMWKALNNFLTIKRY